MPQLIPFQFTNSILSFIVIFSIVLWILSVYVLPIFPRLQLSRLFVINL